MNNLCADPYGPCGLTFDTLREVNVTRCKKWHPPGSIPWTSADWSNALCGEAGELANVVKKIRRQETGATNTGDPKRSSLKPSPVRRSLRLVGSMTEKQAAVMAGIRAQRGDTINR